MVFGAGRAVKIVMALLAQEEEVLLVPEKLGMRMLKVEILVPEVEILQG